MIVIIILFIFGLTIVTLSGIFVTFLDQISKSKITKQTRLIDKKEYLKDLKYKEISSYINCKS